MMAAARAAKRGKSVLLLEKNNRLGKKLSITGGGRCNITNNKPVVRTMLSEYKDSGKFLFSTFMQHGVKESIEWFKVRGVEVIEENEGRLFPSTESAETVCKALADELGDVKVEVNLNTTISGIDFDEKKTQFKVRLQDGSVLLATSCVVATGGLSRPETGSTGEGFAWLKKLGHRINQNNFALVPLSLEDRWVSKVSGVKLDGVKIALYLDDKKIRSKQGKILFTHVGVSGPTILNMSSEVGELLVEGKVTLRIDLFPKLDEVGLKKVFQDNLVNKSNQKLKNVLSDLVPKSLAEVILEILKIDGEEACHSVSTGDRKLILQILKSLELNIKGLLGSDKAVISGGGVDLREIDFKTMGSRIIPGLYLVGDVLDIDRPSGGYSLQLCWSTGFVAGDNV